MSNGDSERPMTNAERVVQRLDGYTQEQHADGIAAARQRRADRLARAERAAAALQAAQPKVLYEGRCCDCCALKIANDDDSACRDYWEHTHRPPRLDERVTRQLNEMTGRTDTAEEWMAWAVVGSEQPVDAVGCDLCGGVDGYHLAHPFYIVR